MNFIKTGLIFTPEVFILCKKGMEAEGLGPSNFNITVLGPSNFNITVLGINKISFRLF